MKILNVRNAQQGLFVGLETIIAEGEERNSRAGNVLQMEVPVTTVYEKPRERVIFYPERDANPFFHFMEGLWMLNGQNDVAFISRYSTNIGQFSDNGVTFHGAYGHRWRRHYPIIQEPEGSVTFMDQLAIIGRRLKENPDDRRCVLSMWDAPVDLDRNGKDVPCNLAIHFSVSINRFPGLDMMVFNRSNDIIWGCYGANVVHFSMLQEVMAAWTGYPVGRYWQVSGNWHAYLATLDKHRGVLTTTTYCPYFAKEVTPYPMVTIDIETWFEDLKIFMMEGPIVGFRDKFFRRVVTPIFHAWEAWKTKDPNRIDNAIEILQQCEATDWKRACVEWLERRRK